jgi:hypothetical protein
MKRLFKIVISAFIFGLLPLSILSGQEKKSEQKVKIIVDDGTGTKVVIDTLIQDGIEMKTFTLKDGKTVFIGHSADDADLVSDGGTKQFIVKVTTDGDDTKEDTREITIFSSDSVKWTAVNKNDRATGKEDGETFTYRIRSGSKESDSEMTRYVIKKDGMVISIEGNEYEKVKELEKEIQDKIDGKKDITENNADNKK